MKLQTLLGQAGLSVWLHTCPQAAGISLGTLPLARQGFLVLACHSPTQPLQRDGISLPSDSISPSAVLFFVPLMHTDVGPAFSRTESDQQPGLILSLASAGQSHSRL